MQTTHSANDHLTQLILYIYTHICEYYGITHIDNVHTSRIGQLAEIEAKNQRNNFMSNLPPSQSLHDTHIRCFMWRTAIGRAAREEENIFVISNPRLATIQP